MIKLNDDLLQELGLAGLPLEEKKRLLAHIYETLEMRVGMKLAQQMTDEQLDEFEQFIKANDEAGALNWLETKFPHYKDVVSAEFETLKGEIRQVAPQILAAGANPIPAPGQQPQPAITQSQQQPMPYGSQPVQGQPMSVPPQPGQPWPTQQPQPAYHQPSQQPQVSGVAQPWPAQPVQPYPTQPSMQQSAGTYGYGAQPTQPAPTQVSGMGPMPPSQQQPPYQQQPGQSQSPAPWTGDQQGPATSSTQQPPRAA